MCGGSPCVASVTLARVPRPLCLACVQAPGRQKTNAPICCGLNCWKKRLRRCDD